MKTTRRFFIGGATSFGALAGTRIAQAGTAQASGKVGETWGGWKPGEFQVHFIYTGVAESMFMIFPDATTMLP